MSRHSPSPSRRMRPGNASFGAESCSTSIRLADVDDSRTGHPQRTPLRDRDSRVYVLKSVLQATRRGSSAAQCLVGRRRTHQAWWARQRREAARTAPIRRSRTDSTGSLTAPLRISPGADDSVRLAIPRERSLTVQTHRVRTAETATRIAITRRRRPLRARGRARRAPRSGVCHPRARWRRWAARAVRAAVSYSVSSCRHVLAEVGAAEPVGQGDSRGWREPGVFGCGVGGTQGGGPGQGVSEEPQRR